MLLGVKRTSTGGNPMSAFDAKRTATLAGDRNRGVSKAFSCRAACGNDISKRILVVDDQPDNRQIIRDMLAPTDYEITEAENGELALAAIAKQRPDLILMDIQLPIMDGYTATSRIKSDPKLRSIPIIAVTSYALSGEERKARAVGCDDCVPKPFSPRQLLPKIRQYMPK